MKKVKKLAAASLFGVLLMLAACQQGGETGGESPAPAETPAAGAAP